jgi:uncharacterized protein (PEP-CTERM system associated)
MRSSLDAILTTRYSDPAARVALVDSLIASRGLQSSFPGAADVFASYAQLHTGVEANWMLLGTRNTVSMSVYGQTLRRLVRPDDPVVPLTAAAADYRQYGGVAAFNRKLSPQTSLDVSLRGSSVIGLGDHEGDKTTEKTFRVAWAREVSPRSTLTIGAQRSLIRTTVSTAWPYSVDSGFIGLRHRF